MLDTIGNLKRKMNDCLGWAQAAKNRGDMLAYNSMIHEAENIQIEIWELEAQETVEAVLMMADPI